MAEIRSGAVDCGEPRSRARRKAGRSPHPPRSLRRRKARPLSVAGSSWTPGLASLRWKASTSPTASSGSIRPGGGCRSTSAPRGKTPSRRSWRTGPGGWTRSGPTRSTGVRPDSDFFLWKITQRYEDLGELGAALNGTPLAGWLQTPYSYLATTKASEYTKARRARKVVPKGSPYLVVYPFVKVRPWYALSPEERQRAMEEHMRDRCGVRDDPQPHHVLVRNRRPGVHDGVRMR